MTTRGRLRRSGVALWRPSWRWARAALRSFVTSFLALTASLWLLPGTQVTRGAESVAYLAVVVLALGALLQPLVTRLAVLTGVVGLLIAGLLTQALVLGIALSVVPTVQPFTLGEIVLASWAAAVAAAAVNWLIDTSSDEVLLGHLLGRAIRDTPEAGALGPGLLVVQWDGVSDPVLRHGLTSGALPTLSRWVRSGSHDLRRWHTGLPATTPAGQAVLLYGDEVQVPGFRWFDKTAGRMRVMSKPADTALLEAELDAARGLLSAGGASISNLFSGGAPTRRLTLSDPQLLARDRGAAAYATLRFGLLHSITLFLGTLATEWHQSRRQRIREVEPRVRRGSVFALQRGLTTVLLRDLNVALVVEQLIHGAPVVFVDFVDYDEVAHHAGPTRPEAMRRLEKLDRVAHLLEQVAGVVGRRYEIAVVSDHGQTQGVTFEQRTGHDLAEVVHGLVEHRAGGPAPSMPAETAAETGRFEEAWIPLHQLSAGTGLGRALARLVPSWRRRGRGGDAAGSRGGTGAAQPDASAETAEVVVAASGSLAHVYLSAADGRATREWLEEHHPALIWGLREQVGIGVVVTRRGDGLVVVEGSSGSLLVDPARGPGGEVVSASGRDPLAAYGDSALADVVALERRRHVGDLWLLAEHDPTLGEVAAFEDLVGSHGGLGGPQTQAFLLHPSGWRLPDGVLTGPEVYAGLRDRLIEQGLRTAPAAMPTTWSAPRPGTGPTTPPAVTWWGHASAAVELDGVVVATDPLLVDRLFHLRRYAESPSAEATHPDLIVISHLHADHLHPASLRRCDRSAVMVAPPGAESMLHRLGFERVQAARPGDVLDVDLDGRRVRVEVLAATHDGRRSALHRHHSPALGFRVSSAGRSFWFPGDTELRPDMTEVDPVDLALVPVGGWGPTLHTGHMGPIDAAEAVRRVGARVAVPVHWGTFWPVGLRRIGPGNHHRLFVSPGPRFAEEVADAGLDTRVVVARPGERIEW